MCVLQGFKQGSTAPCTQVCKPIRNLLTGSTSLGKPVRLYACCAQHRYACPCTVSLLEKTQQYAFGLHQGAMTSHGRRGIDNEQPMLSWRLRARPAYQVSLT